jgi:hypothetical protein
MNARQKRTYTIHFNNQTLVDIDADWYEVIYFFLPGHYFYLQEQKIAFFNFDDVSYVTSKEIKDND